MADRSGAWRGRWLRFSLRQFLVFMVVTSAACGLIGMRVRTARRQVEAVKVILAAGGQVVYETTSFAVARPPLWVRRLLGPDFFRNVTKVDLRYTYASDEEVKSVAHLGYLKDLDIRHTFVSDSGLAHLGRLRDLQQLRIAARNRDSITDTGVAHLYDLSNLTLLELRNTNVTDAALRRADSWPHLRWLCLGGTKVSDQGMMHLADLGELRTLIVSSASVTKAGVKELQRRLPQCEVMNVNRR